jgi:hypothetical protein
LSPRVQRRCHSHNRESKIWLRLESAALAADFFCRDF